MSVTVVLSISFDRDESQFCNLIFMNSSPDNQHFICEQKEKSVRNFRTFTICKMYKMNCKKMHRFAKLNVALPCHMKNRNQRLIQQYLHIK